ncbi:MAG: DUF5687 family protein [Flavobacteriaceae bacterium]|nr:DUF5687 family protein [Flavobacteriaceae bacterium]
MFESVDFRSLRKKEWKRGAQWESKLIVRILIILFAIYMAICFFFIGIGGYFILEKKFPGQSPSGMANNFLFYYLGAELILRYMIQQLPITRIQHFMLLSIPKKRVVQNVLNRSLSSFYNSSLLFLFLPFAIVMAVKEENYLASAAWWLSISLLILSIGNIVYLLNKSRWFSPIAAGYASVVLLDKLEIFSVPKWLGEGMNRLLENPMWIGIPIVVFVLSYRLTKGHLIRNFYLDAALKKKREKMLAGELKAFNRLGLRGVFLKNDIRLLLRNIRVRQILFGAAGFLLYGLVFFPQEIYQESAMEVFAALFTTGGFVLMFSQNIPAWDSAYFKLLMTQRIPLYEYLYSKWLLLVVSVALASVLAIPYLYFGFRVYSLILAASIFNAGMGSFIGLISGALNHTPIQLNIKAKAFENTQNFNLTQFLFVIPKIAIPVLLYWLPNHYLGPPWGVVTLAGSGLLGLIFQKPILQLCVRFYQQKKHEMLEGFYKNS